MKKSTIAFIIAPSVAPLMYMLFNFITTSGRTSDLAGAFIIACICYAWALFAGLPLIKLMERKKWSKWWQYFTVGFVSGTPFAILWFLFCSSMMFIMFFSAGLVAGVSAITYWLFLRTST
jgi:hypothetical protein